MDDMRSCTRRGDHLNTCANDNCKGCLPREAKHGLLCWNCWERVQQAVALCDPWLDATRGLTKVIQRDSSGISGSSTGYIPIPSLELARDEIWSYLKTWTTTADNWVASKTGAEDAVRFARAVQTAIRSHPTEEVQHKVNRTRCPKCNVLSLVWTPPTIFGSNVTVDCTNCGHSIPQESFEKLVTIEKPGAKQPADLLMDAGAPLNVDRNLAEPFDPRKPEHAELLT